MTQNTWIKGLTHSYKVFADRMDKHSDAHSNSTAR